MFDYHIHTNMSIDSGLTALQVAKRAKELALKEICITNHQDWPEVISEEYRFASTDSDWNKFFLELAEAKKAFPNIKFGCELGYFPESRNEIPEFASQHQFDYIIGSVHRLNGLYVPDPQLVFPDTDVKEWYKQYFIRLKEAILAGYFDCVGHFDVVKKTAPPLSIEHYKDEVSGCISAMKKMDIGFELNTMGWHYKCKDCFPSADIMKMMHAAGIRKVTIGSDSHTVDKIGFEIDKGLALLKEIGFEEICTFTRRKPVFHRL